MLSILKSFSNFIKHDVSFLSGHMTHADRIPGAVVHLTTDCPIAKNQTALQQKEEYQMQKARIRILIQAI